MFEYLTFLDLQFESEWVRTKKSFYNAQAPGGQPTGVSDEPVLPKPGASAEMRVMLFSNQQYQKLNAAMIAGRVLSYAYLAKVRGWGDHGEQACMYFTFYGVCIDQCLWGPNGAIVDFGYNFLQQTTVPIPPFSAISSTRPKPHLPLMPPKGPKPHLPSRLAGLKM
jgi:hypothetical protein